MSKGKTKPAREGLNASPTHLLHRALQLALDFHADAAGPSALTQRQFTVLAAASNAEGLTQNDLVRATGIDRSTLADLVARLLAKGLLLRERSATDGRANTVRLSDAGRDALAQGAGAATTADQRLLGLLSPKKRDGFMKTLASLAAAADAPPPAKEAKAAKTTKAAKTDKAAKPAKTDRTKKKRRKGAKKAKATGPISEAAA
ncbi:MAG: MarR family transcriptional regulator [Caulobacteraceae bacterium]|nr:MarR family transcriptional regulator [Caulobacteraceae bacterium]